MTIAFMIAVYFIIWWTVLFVVLPFGVQTQAEAGSVVPGTPGSAPADFPVRRVVLITSAVSAVVFALLWLAFSFGIIDMQALTTVSTEPRR